MSTIKTKSGVKKRFKCTGTGKLKHRRSYRSHLLNKKDTARKRRLRAMGLITGTDAKRMHKMMY